MNNKVLIGVVTSIYKDYCYQEFSSQLRALQSQGHNVLIVDNSFCTPCREGFKTIKTLGIHTLNGTPITLVGYGCTLVRRKVLECIKFVTGRTPDSDGRMPFPDSYFHYDVNRCGYSNRLDTDFIAEHRNLMNETERYRQIINGAHSH